MFYYVYVCVCSRHSENDSDTAVKSTSGRWYGQYGQTDGNVDSAPTSSAFLKAVSAGKSSGHRNIASIKKRIKQFEEEFENKFGYKPSHSEKLKHKDIKKYMNELSKMRKELKSESLYLFLKFDIAASFQASLVVQPHSKPRW